MGAINSCFYSDMTIQATDNLAIDVERKIFQDIPYFGRYGNDCIRMWTVDGK